MAVAKMPKTVTVDVLALAFLVATTQIGLFVFVVTSPKAKLLSLSSTF